MLNILYFVLWIGGFALIGVLFQKKWTGTWGVKKRLAVIAGAMGLFLLSILIMAIDRSG